MRESQLEFVGHNSTKIDDSPTLQQKPISTSNESVQTISESTIDPQVWKPLESFPLLVLPKELRLKVWDQVIARPRVLEFKAREWGETSWWIHSVPAIATQINQESRSHAMVTYEILAFCNDHTCFFQCIHPGRRCTRAYINVHVDMVYFCPKDLSSETIGHFRIRQMLKLGLSGLMRSPFPKVQHLAFELKTLQPKGLAPLLVDAKDLKTINLVLEDICIQEREPMGMSTAPHSLAKGYGERSTRFYKYERWGKMWNMRLEILDYRWPKEFKQMAGRLIAFLEKKGMDEKTSDALIIRPIDIFRAGADRDSPCGRVTVYPDSN
ncbi:hypothetical protein EG329_002031 [Mollisiaceae sp. DMI_Dod_QoI]|nr:hypothetical protein EG329_002031 [Helotiales sp. DMI_Dod_QoI]